MTAPAGDDICFTLNIVDEVELAVECCEAIHRVYPSAHIVLMVDQADRPGADVVARVFAAGRFNAQVVPCQTHLYAVRNAGLVVSEHLRMFLRTSAKWWFKIDADTRLNRPFRDLPDDTCFFGTLQSGQPRQSLQGGCIGGTRVAADAVFRSGVLASPVLGAPEQSWAGSNPHLLMRIADEGLVSFDFIHAWACEQLDIPLRSHPEIMSCWLAPPEHASTYAVSHPYGPGYGVAAPDRVMETVRRLVPAGSSLAIMGTRGAPVGVDACRASDFAEHPSRSVSKWRSTDVAPLVAYTDECEALGANFLVIPQHAIGWCLHVVDYWQYLEDHYPRLWRDKNCLVYQLGPPVPRDAMTASAPMLLTDRRRATSAPPLPDAGIERAKAVAERILPGAASVAMVQPLADGRATLLERRHWTHGSAVRRNQRTIAASDDPLDLKAMLIRRRHHFLVWMRTETPAEFEPLRWYLESCFPRVWSDRYLTIYQLRAPAGSSRSLRSAVPPTPERPLPSENPQIDQIRHVIQRIMPLRHRLAVISRGDDALVHAVGGGHPAMHFPQTDDGVYAGYHPEDSEEALQQLAAVMRLGATHLLVPGTALWWLDHYDGFARHLATSGRELWRDEHCAIFRLAGRRAAKQSATRKKPHRPRRR